MSVSVKREGVSRSKLEQIISGLGDYTGRVGWDASAVYPNGTKTAEVAATQEFGDPAHNIPSRSFIRSTMREKESEWKELSFKLSKSVISGQRTARDAFELLVQSAEGNIAEKITTLTEPPLKEATIHERMERRKDKKTVGNLTKPLVDTGYMLSTLTSAIE